MRKNCFGFACKNKIVQLECKIQVIGVDYTGHHALGLTAQQHLIEFCYWSCIARSPVQMSPALLKN